MDILKKEMKNHLSKAKKLLGYDPDYDFKKGLELAIDWYKKNL